MSQDAKCMHCDESLYCLCCKHSIRDYGLAPYGESPFGNDERGQKFAVARLAVTYLAAGVLSASTGGLEAPATVARHLWEFIVETSSEEPTL